MIQKSFNQDIRLVSRISSQNIQRKHNTKSMKELVVVILNTESNFN